MNNRLVVCCLLLLLPLLSAAQSQSPLSAKVRYWTMANGLSSNEVYAVTMDQRSVLWIATKFGLNRFDGYEFKVYTADDGLYSNHISDLFMEKGRFLWLFFKERAADVDQLVTIQVLDVFSGNIQSIEAYLGRRLPFTVSDIGEITIRDAYLFFHQQAGAVFHYETATGFRKVEYLQPSESLVHYHNQRYWSIRTVADTAWLVTCAIDSGQREQYKLGSARTHRYQWLNQDNDGRIVLYRSWLRGILADIDFVFVHPEKSDSYDIEQYVPGFQFSSHDEILYHPDLQAYWLVSHANGLLFTAAGKERYRYQRQQGARPLVMSINQSATGLRQYTMQEVDPILMNYKRQNLLQGHSIWQCTGVGLLEFNFAAAATQLPEAMPVVVEVQQYVGKSRQLENRTTDFFENGRLTLQPDDRFISLKLSISQQARLQPITRFYYRLKNKQSQWLQINDNVLVLGNLPYGKPIVQLKAVGIVGGESSILEVPVLIDKPYYLQGWFIAGCISLVLVFFYGLYRYQLAQYRKSQALRTQIAADLHDEMGALLSRLTFQSEMVKYVSSTRVTQILQDIASTSRYALDMMRDIVWSIDARNDANENIILRMEKQLEEMLSPVGIHYTIDSRAVMSYHPILPEVRQDIFFIFKEAITNTVRHGKPRQVAVRLQHNYSFFQLEIKELYAEKDLLLPIEEFGAKSKKSGSGLQNMHFRAERIKAELSITPSGSGYTVLLTKKW